MKNEAFLYSYTAPRLFERHDYVRQYTPLVRRIAHQMVAKLPANVELDDMIQAGMMGLMDAICRFEESQGTQFEVYASQRVRGAMLDELRARTTGCRVRHGAASATSRMRFIDSKASSSARRTRRRSPRNSLCRSPSTARC